MAAHELRHDRVDGVGHAEGAAFLGDAGEEHHLEEQIAELLAEASRVAGVERLERFVGLFEEIGP